MHLSVDLILFIMLGIWWALHIISYEKLSLSFKKFDIVVYTPCLQFRSSCSLLHP